MIQQKTLPDQPFLGSIQYTVGRPLDYYDGEHIQKHPPCDVMMWDSGSRMVLRFPRHWLKTNIMKVALNNVAELADSSIILTSSIILPNVPVRYSLSVEVQYLDEITFIGRGVQLYKKIILPF